MLLNIETFREQDKECSQEWLVNTDPGYQLSFRNVFKNSYQGLYQMGIIVERIKGKQQMKYVGKERTFTPKPWAINLNRDV